MLENVLKWSTDSDTNLTVVCRHRWRTTVRLVSLSVLHFNTFSKLLLLLLLLS